MYSPCEVKLKGDTVAQTSSIWVTRKERFFAANRGKCSILDHNANLKNGTLPSSGIVFPPMIRKG